ncbi:hypothetical protein N8H74_01065 [Pseudomonas sp. B2M1-30]|uniref:hypothetical protein n=1 Tax=Pseudomonas TaxID=286 RepID=UPI0021CA5319|nr:MULTISPECIES: hypothetical protein [Pseudomonas]MCU0116824.1 hypothetical protein [Pseudomonas sp. B2M1-30]MCU7260217.1 hypothetical protein [Pseudomonas koreensis]
MNITYKLFSYIYPIALTITSGAGILILVENLEAGAYDVNQDSIGLPIGVTLVIFLTLALTHLLQIFLLCRGHANFFAGLLLKISSCLFATVSLVILVDRIVYWSIPNHAIIAILYGVTAVTFVALQMQTFAQWK